MFRWADEDNIQANIKHSSQSCKQFRSRFRAVAEGKSQRQNKRRLIHRHGRVITQSILLQFHSTNLLIKNKGLAKLECFVLSCLSFGRSKRRESSPSPPSLTPGGSMTGECNHSSLSTEAYVHRCMPCVTTIWPIDTNDLLPQNGRKTELPVLLETLLFALWCPKRQSQLYPLEIETKYAHIFSYRNDFWMPDWRIVSAWPLCSCCDIFLEL